MARHDKSGRRYLGITKANVVELLDDQEYCCAICGREIDLSSAVDHDHTTGKIRGMLCLSCNCGLGQFRDDIGLLAKAIFYLGQHSIE